MSLLLFNLVLEYAIKKIQKSGDSLQLNNITQLLIYTNNVVLLGNNRETLIDNTKDLIDKTKKLGLQISTEELNIWSLIGSRIFEIYMD